MRCASCESAMTVRVFDGQLGSAVTVDYCGACQVFWFDRYESLQITPGATLALFKIIGDASAEGPPRPPRGGTCPRCEATLVHTHDLQRATPFEYFRCPRGHGRLISFYHFLREKHYIRPLSPAQIAEIGKRIGSIHCPNCGAPVRLDAEAACSHCGSPLSGLDVEQAAQLIAELRTIDQAPAVDTPAAGTRSAPRQALPTDAPVPDLIGGALRSLVALLSARIR